MAADSASPDLADPAPARVGTTNRTRSADYAAAISDRTALILRVHPSNFRIEGFTERPDLADLAALAHRLPTLVEDAPTRWVWGLDPPPPSLAHEPSVVDSLRAGSDIVTFSGDKLLDPDPASRINRRPTTSWAIGRHPGACGSR